MAEQVYLAIDLGAESGRVMAGMFDGQKIRLEELHRFSNGPVNVGDTMRWDVLRLWSQIQVGLQKAAARFGQNIVSVGVDTWGVDFVLLSKTGEMLGQPYHYRDARTRGVMDLAFQRVPRAEVFANTGLQFMEINSLYQLIVMNQTNPELMGLADKFLMMPDFFHWLLSGSRVVEFTNATTSQMYHPTQRNWSVEMLRKLGLPTHMLPEVVGPGTRLGRLREDVARRAGLPRLDVVAPATHDTGAAIAAVPTDRTGSGNWAYISSGTWSLMGLELPHAVLTPRALELNVTNEGGIDGTYRLLKNIMGLWLVQECRKSFERNGSPYDYGLLAQVARDARPFRAFVNPDAPEFLAPHDMPEAMRDWCRATNQEIPDTDGGLVRCALESLALKYRMVLGWLEELSGHKVEVIHIVGGGTQNELLNQFTANATGRPVITGPVEATALGNVLVQARTSGSVGSLSQIREIVRASCTMQRYEPQNTAQWNDAYVRFCELLKQPR
ncbi:rhamnulokinase [Schlesneria paludicola]|uniref:rhamnulokinase n=1 Tax=Schlesneria paludicola TaxID=360056 RepID=UPI000299D73E|nr:rhamnulokinase family protein [Schlesneria paludicola]